MSSPPRSASGGSSRTSSGPRRRRRRPREERRARVELAGAREAAQAVLNAAEARLDTRSYDPEPPVARGALDRVQDRVVRDPEPEGLLVDQGELEIGRSRPRLDALRGKRVVDRVDGVAARDRRPAVAELHLREQLDRLRTDDE